MNFCSNSNFCQAPAGRLRLGAIFKKGQSSALHTFIHIATPYFYDAGVITWFPPMIELGKKSAVFSGA
jgi:hypothetical protein